MPVRTPPTPAETEAALREVFARPELTPPPPSPLSQWLGRAWEWVKGLWDRLFPDLALTDTVSGALGWTVIGVLAVVGLGIALHLLLQAGGAWRGRSGERREAAPGGLASARGMRAGDWETLARRAAEEGRWRDAALALYQALLFRLHDRGVLRYDPSKTPGDYRRELRRAGGAGQPFERFVRLFEPVAFGGRGLDGAGYEQLRALAAEGGARG